ncbi:hypothetical protein SEEGA711_19886 [Salmonella enterica subsp. enterica serovar Gaminara str. ATCC BAA-711]|nr:hypothetical protein SEEGA711_19886 [Salmonella enterica subsp. enterica serovar Gaminara str. ATCC BAA-711]
MQNNCSSLVMRFGATTLIAAIFHSVATFFNATARKGIIAELKAEKPPVATKKKAKKIDNKLK